MSKRMQLLRLFLPGWTFLPGCPHGQSARTVCADRLPGRSARTVRADRPRGPSARTVRADRLRRPAALHGKNVQPSKKRRRSCIRFDIQKRLGVSIACACQGDLPVKNNQFPGKPLLPSYLVRPSSKMPGKIRLSSPAPQPGQFLIWRNGASDPIDLRSDPTPFKQVQGLIVHRILN